MNRDKMRGHLFENMVIFEIMKVRYNHGKNGGLYFYRDSTGNEVDLLVSSGSGYRCYEIKSSATFHPDFVRGLEQFGRSFPAFTVDKTVIYAGTGGMEYNGVRIESFRTGGL